MSLVLAFVMCISLFANWPMPAFATEGDILKVYQNGSEVTSVIFPSNKVACITAKANVGETNYQWQIQIPGSNQWANILGETSDSLNVSYALIKNMQNNSGSAVIRCVATYNDKQIATKGITVSVGAAEHPEIVIPEYVPVAAPVNQAKQVAEPVMEVAEVETDMQVDGAATFATRAVTPATYTITINYVFEDDTMAAESWHGQFTEGVDYELNVDSPVVHGYQYDIANITQSFNDIDSNHIFTVTYTPTNVAYKVERWQQNVNDDGYTRVDSDTMDCSALTNTPVGDSFNGVAYAKEYTGFKVLDFDTTLPVAADGSTVVKVYYDRLYYLMSFELDDQGYGVQPIYARYGTAIPQDLTPIRPGYAFTGWTPAIPSTMPAENTTYTAGWQAGKKVGVNLVFWYENANDNGYTCVGSASADTAYTAGATIKPSDFKDVSFTGRDNIHFVFNSSKNDAVTLNPDGSTIVNIYFTRKTYKMIFFNCRQSGHVSDEASCYPATRAQALDYVKNYSDCVDEKLDPSGNWIWGISIYTRKWQENVRPDWEAGIANRANTRRWMPYEVYGAAGQLIYNGTLNVSTMNVMPDADIVFRFFSTGKTECTMNYWITPVPGESTAGKTTKTADGVTYVLRNQVVTMMGGITENEEYVDIEGYTKVYTWAQLAQKGYRIDGDDTATAHFFYKRNGYNLTYISNGATDRIAKDIPFEALLKTASNYNAAPSYPSNYEPGAYEFKGWYTTENCADGTKVDWNKAKMPVGGTSVYAKWEPVSHTVTITGEGVTSQTFNAEHGKVVVNAPEDPTKEGYEFISWFYTDKNGKEVPFTFDMPISQDMTIYPKWRQVAIVKGTLYFELKDSDTAVAAPQPIESLIGETKTYSAKTVEELYDNYKIGYFPETVSTNISFGDDEAKNTYTFEYVYKEKVPYTVKYLEVGTEKELAAAKNTESSYASVVENFKPIAGYLPDVYKKQLLLSANGTNELIFWYTEDDEHAPVLRGHYKENADDDNYTTYQEVLDSYGVIGETYTEPPFTFDGFVLNENKSIQSGVLAAGGLELKLYYDRIEYPYEFRFVDQDGKTIRDAIIGTAKYESTVTQSALDIPGYTLREMDPSQEEQSIVIQIEENDTAVNNIKTFVYDAAYTSLTIKKDVIGALDANQTFVFNIVGTPDNKPLGSIDLTVVIAGNGTVKIPQLPVGTYNITEETDWSWRYGDKPTQITVNSGEVSISDKSVVVKASDPTVEYIATFENTRSENKWLDGNDYRENSFAAVTANS